jgi:putative ABC transport system substrate-binding protein
MRRRELIKVIAGAVAARPLAALAQQAGPASLIGVLMEHAEDSPAAQAWLAAFRDELAKLGWKDGSNLRVELRWSGGNAEKLRAFARELVDLQPAAILCRGTSETDALARETRTIPIVFAAVSDPIASGFVASLARPGGNITGFTNVESTLGGKWVELLKEVAPRMTRATLLFNPATPATLQFYLPSIQAAAQSLAVEVSHAPVQARDGIEAVVAAMARDAGCGLIAMPDPFTGTNLGLIVALASRYRIPAISYPPCMRNRAA